MEPEIDVVVHETEDAIYFTPKNSDGVVIEDAWNAEVVAEFEQLAFVKKAVLEQGHLGIFLDVRTLTGDDYIVNHDDLNALLLRALGKSEGEVSFLTCGCMQAMSRFIDIILVTTLLSSTPEVTLD